MNWNAIGWKIEVKFTERGSRIRPADHMEILGPRLPTKYSPLLRSRGPVSGSTTPKNSSDRTSEPRPEPLLLDRALERLTDKPLVRYTTLLRHTFHSAQ